MPDVHPKVFLSYSHSDHGTVAAIKELLTEREIRVQWDREFRHGEKWTDQMLEGLRESDCIVVCWSKTAVESEIIKNEFFAGYLQQKFVGIALEPHIEYPGISGDPHHEAYYEWNDSNRAERLAALVASIRRVAARRNPRVSNEDIANAVRRVDRSEQAQKVAETLSAGLTVDAGGFCFLVAANNYERAEEFARRAGAELIPEHLKRLGIISDGNDEGYEIEFYALGWPSGYRSTDEALSAIFKGLADIIPGETEDRADLGDCVRATGTIAPIVFLEMPLQNWAPGNRDVLEALIAAFENVRQDPAIRRYPILFVAAQYYEDRERRVRLEGSGFLGGLFGKREDIDVLLQAVASGGSRRSALPTLPMVARQHVDAWYQETHRVLQIPEEFREDVRHRIHEPYLTRRSSEEHYQEIAHCMRKALREVFLGGARN